jgi:hypothetical protein
MASRNRHYSAGVWMTENTKTRGDVVILSETTGRSEVVGPRATAFDALNKEAT